MGLSRRSPAGRPVRPRAGSGGRGTALIMGAAAAPTTAVAGPPAREDLSFAGRLIWDVADVIGVPHVVLTDIAALVLLVSIAVAAAATAIAWRAQRARQKTLGYLEAIGEATTDIFWATDRDGTIIYLNPVGQRFSYLVEDPVFGSEPGGWRDAQARCLSEGEKQFAVGEFPLPDGSRGHYRAFVAPLRDRGGQVVGAVGQSTNMTEALANAALLRAIGNAPPAAIFARDTELRFTYANTRFLSRTGLSASEVLGRTALELFPDSDWRLDDEWRDVVTKGVHFDVQLPAIETVAGRLVGRVRLSPVRDEEGRLIGGVGVAEDVSREVALTEEAARSAERYRMVSELTPNILWSLTSEGGIDYVNERWEQFVGPGHRPEDWASLVHRADRRRVMASRDEASKAQKPWREQFRLRHRSGAFRWVLVRAFRSTRETENGGRYFGSFTDIDELVRAQEQARTLQAEAAHLGRVADMGQVASSLAHEINQPLAAAMNYVEGAARRLGPGPEADGARQGLALASDQLARAGDIIRRLRDFLRRRPARRSAEPLEPLLRRAVELSLLGAREGGVQVAYEIEAEPCRIWADPVQIEQVVLNLVRNAIDAVEAVADRRITVGLHPASAGMVELRVSDNGPGISTEVHKRLFTPFETTKADGMGIGLSISRTIVEAHGGRIWADPPNGAGATFHVLLPLEPGEGRKNAA